MKPSRLLAAAAAALIMAASAHASPQHHQHRWHDLSLKQRHQVVTREIGVHRTVIHWWLSQRRRPQSSASLYCTAIGIRAPGAICVHGQRLVRALHVETRIEAKIAARARPRFAKWLVDAFKCIHHYEGSWVANTGNGYYGGLQMDRGFMNHYGAVYVGRWGTADRWPIWAQMDAAIRAHDSGRGFSPWPNTARVCGLL